VKTLKLWERNTLVEVDQKYDPDDDSSDEEAIRIRAERNAKNPPPVVEAEKKAAAPKAKGKK